MTRAEYEALYRKAKLQNGLLSLKTQAKIRAAYKSAAKLASTTVLEAEMAGKSELTIESQAALSNALSRGAYDVQQAIREVVPLSISLGYQRYSDIAVDYIYDAVVEAGAQGKISKTGLITLFGQINDRLVASFANRVWQDGYNFSNRVIKAGENYQDAIKSLVAAGFAGGRDNVKIAGDITAYINLGREGVVQARWGGLLPGTSEFVKRIPRRVDWRAVRIVRSEFYSSLQDGAVLTGETNPAATGKFNWVPTSGNVCPICQGHAANGPYTKSTVPSYPHPHCACVVQPIMVDLREFVSDLKKWVKGEKIDSLDDWYRKYLGSQ